MVIFPGRCQHEMDCQMAGVRGHVEIAVEQGAPEVNIALMRHREPVGALPISEATGARDARIRAGELTDVRNRARASTGRKTCSGLPSSPSPSRCAGQTAWGNPVRRRDNRRADRPCLRRTSPHDRSLCASKENALPVAPTGVATGRWTPRWAWTTREGVNKMPATDCSVTGEPRPCPHLVSSPSTSCILEYTPAYRMSN